nr:11128_t:CDS:2 [Entrophospora candida]
MYYASGSLATYFDVSYDKQIQGVGSKSIADEFIENIKKYIPDDFITNYDVFIQTVQSDAYSFKPIGEKICEYNIDDEDDTSYEIYMGTFLTPGLKQYHRRLRTFVLYYIEVAGGENIYSIVGFCTAYPYYFYDLEKIINGTKSNMNNEKSILLINEDINPITSIRMRISQYVVFPPFRNKGHGGKLYQALYNNYLADSRIKEITVEDPNEAFQELRDRKDLAFIMENKLFEGLKAPVDKKLIESLRKKYKFEKRQFSRCLEILLLRSLDKTNVEEYKAYRLQVKERLYHWNAESLRQFTVDERKQHLGETFNSLIEEYHSIILKL